MICAAAAVSGNTRPARAGGPVQGPPLRHRDRRGVEPPAAAKAPAQGHPQARPTQRLLTGPKEPQGLGSLLLRPDFPKPDSDSRSPTRIPRNPTQIREAEPPANGCPRGGGSVSPLEQRSPAPLTDLPPPSPGFAGSQGRGGRGAPKKATGSLFKSKNYHSDHSIMLVLDSNHHHHGDGWIP